MDKLPEAITIGRLVQEFSLEVIGESRVIDLSIANLAIQTLHFFEGKDIILPFPGSEISLRAGESCFELVLQFESSEIIIVLESRDLLQWPEFCRNVEIWLEREQGRILAVSERYSQLLTERLAQGNVLDSLQSLQYLMGYDVFLLNKQLDILAWAGGHLIPSSPIPFLSPKRVIGLSLPSLSLSNPSFGGEWKEEAYRQVPLTWYPISGQQGILGYLGIAAQIMEIGSLEQLFLYKTATLLFLELIKTQCVQENELLHYRDFLFDLLYNNFDSLEVICSRGKLWGWDLSYPHLVIVGEIKDFNPYSSDRELLQDLIGGITRNLKRNRSQGILIERNDQLVMLFPLKQMLPPTEWSPAADKILEAIKDSVLNVLEKRELIFGLGNVYPLARDIHRSFQEAKAALELGKIFNLEKKLTSFHNSGIIRLLYHLDYQELEDFRSEVLGPLLAFDVESNLALEETLLTYFTCNTDLNSAAQKLFLHPNTLRYRLKKAAEVLGCDLSSLENQLNIYTALKIGCLKPLQ